MFPMPRTRPTARPRGPMARCASTWVACCWGRSLGSAPRSSSPRSSTAWPPTPTTATREVSSPVTRREGTKEKSCLDQNDTTDNAVFLACFFSSLTLNWVSFEQCYSPWDRHLGPCSVAGPVLSLPGPGPAPSSPLPFRLLQRPVWARALLQARWTVTASCRTEPHTESRRLCACRAEHRLDGVPAARRLLLRAVFSRALRHGSG